MNVWDILILLLLAAVLVLAVLRLRKRRGGCSCGGGSCTGCAGGRDCPACRPAESREDNENEERR